MIIHVFIKWHPWLEGSPHTTKVILDYRNLTHFTTY
jgi:hypothetical protein